MGRRENAPRLSNSYNYRILIRAIEIPQSLSDIGKQSDEKSARAILPQEGSIDQRERCGERSGRAVGAELGESTPIISDEESQCSPSAVSKQ